MYDSVYVFAQGLAALDRGHILKPANLSCELEQPWNDGLSLYNYINAVSNSHTSHLLHADMKVQGWTLGRTPNVSVSNFSPGQNFGLRQFVGPIREFLGEHRKLKHGTTLYFHETD